MTHHTGSVPDTPRSAYWGDQAACLDQDPELFFPKGYEGPWQHVIEDAKQVCRRCPVADACLQFALDNPRITDGIFGGLTTTERTALRRSTARNALTAEAAAQKAKKARQTTKPTTLRGLFDNHTVRLIHGHLAWTGPKKPSFKGREYTPKQLSFVVDRGYDPTGRVVSACGITSCVLAAHLADDDERMVCGTRNGYHQHLREGSEVCPECRQANTDANNRLLRTGSTKALAS